MLDRFFSFFRPNKRYDRSNEIAPDEVLLDASNLPHFNTHQFEGRIEKPISRRTVVFLGAAFFLVGAAFAVKLWRLQVRDGQLYADRAEKNALRDTTLFPRRGMITDRNGVPLAWNEPISDESDFLGRRYTTLSGFSHLLGYVKYPKQDSSGIYYSTSFVPTGGIEERYDSLLSGQNGTKIVEVNARGSVASESVIDQAKDGANLALTIDSRVQHSLEQFIASTAKSTGYHGGAGIVMDVQTGDIVALTSYPEFSSEVMVEGTDADTIAGYASNKDNPFLDRALSGVYTPGSVIKPFIAIGALAQGVITPEKQILSTGSISIPNPYDPKLQSVFKDWRAQGWVDMRHAIAVSSDVYFYEVGGGYQDQPGLGIDNIDKYTRLFGFGAEVPGDPLFAGKKGTIPTPEWKKENFNGDDWRIGDTYHTAIGQYGFQVTPIQMIRAVSSIANGGTLPQPRILENGGEVPTGIKLPFPESYYQIVREGMRMGVNEGGTGKNLDVPYVQVASKTGTAQLGLYNEFVNSWAMGFFPYQHPKYAFAVIMEKGPSTATIGGVYVMRQLLDWMSTSTPEYFK